MKTIDFTQKQVTKILQISYYKKTQKTFVNYIDMGLWI